MSVDQRRPKKLTPKGTPPMPTRKPPVPGSGRGRAAKFYNPVTKEWTRAR